MKKISGENLVVHQNIIIKIVWWYRSIILIFRRLRQEESCKFKTSLVYRVSPRRSGAAYNKT